MKNEIIEIKINKANKSITFINNGIAFSQFGIADEILDLITNLQEEINKLTAESTEWESKCYDLQKENEILKEQNVCVGCNNNPDYKSRNEKAREIYKNRNTCKYKKERFMEDKSTSDLMYEALTGGDE